MPTKKQILGTLGEKLVAKTMVCPNCKKPKTLKTLIQNFKCADIICDFCGYLAQVKTISRKNIDQLPKKIIGAAWKPLKERMDDGRFFPLYIVMMAEKVRGKKQVFSIYYLAAEHQPLEMFLPRKPLSEKAERKGWQGVTYDLEIVKDHFVILAPTLAPNP